MCGRRTGEYRSRPALFERYFLFFQSLAHFGLPRRTPSNVWCIARPDSPQKENPGEAPIGWCLPAQHWLLRR